MTSPTPFRQPVASRFTIEQRAQLLRIPEVAAFLAVSRPTVYRLIGSGALPVVTQAGARRVRLTDLVGYVERLTP